LIQENSIEFLVQSIYLIYTRSIVHAKPHLTNLKGSALYIRLKYIIFQNLLYLSSVSYDYVTITVTVIYDITLNFHPKSQNMKIKMKIRKENKLN